MRAKTLHGRRVAGVPAFKTRVKQHNHAGPTRPRLVSGRGRMLIGRSPCSHWPCPSAVTPANLNMAAISLFQSADNLLRLFYSIRLHHFLRASRQFAQLALGLPGCTAVARPLTIQYHHCQRHPFCPAIDLGRGAIVTAGRSCAVHR